MDLVYRLDHPLGPNEKQRALDHLIVAGGPATNAAVTFAALGGVAEVLSVFGTGPLGHLARNELTQWAVGCMEAGNEAAALPVSSILVQRQGGDRAVISLNDGGATSVAVPPNLDERVRAADVVLIDGHYAELAIAAAESAHRQSVPVVFDGGSWKPRTPELLPHVDLAVCSADFHVPGVAEDDGAVLDFLLGLGIRVAAISHGGESLVWSSGGVLEKIDVARGPIVDTLGAGDVLHGGLAHAIAAEPTVIAEQERVASALRFGCELATFACGFFGTRAWIRPWQERSGPRGS